MPESTDPDRLLISLGPDLRPVETLRRICLGWSMFAWLAFALTIALAFTEHAVDAVLVLYCALLGPLAGLFFLHSQRQTFARRYKRVVLKALVSHQDPDLRYFGDSSVSKKDIDGSMLMDIWGEEVRGEDHVWGRIGGREASFCELMKIWGGDVRCFRRAFFSATLDETITGHVVVRPNRWWGFMWVTPRHGPVVQLPDQAFARAFVVHASDEALAHQVLTAPLRERMLELQRGARGDLSFAWVGRRLYLTIAHDQNLFEPSLIATASDPRQLAINLRDLQFMLGILDALGLASPAEHHSRVE